MPRRLPRLLPRLLRRPLGWLPWAVATLLLAALLVTLLVQIDRTVTVDGEIRVRRYQVVRADFAARVAEVWVAPGDVVRQGQPLLRLVDEALEQGLRDARAERQRIGQQLSGQQTELHLASGEIHPQQRGLLEQRLASAQVAVAVAESRVAEVALELEAAGSRLSRSHALAAAGLTSTSAVEQAGFDEATWRERHRRRQLDVDLARLEVGTLERQLQSLDAEQRRDLLRLDMEIQPLIARGELLAGRLGELEARLERRLLRADFDGVVAGDTAAELLNRWVGAGEELLQIIDPATVELESLVPEHALVRVRPGQEVRVALDGLPRRRFGVFDGRVEAVATLPAQSLTSQAGYPVTIRLHRPWVDLADGRFVVRSGMRGSAEISYRRRVPLLRVAWELVTKKNDTV